MNSFISKRTGIAFLFVLCLCSTIRSQTVWHNPMAEAVPTMQGRSWNKEIGTSIQRMPQRAKDEVRKPVWELSQQTAGLYVQFFTNAPTIKIRYQVTGGLSMVHMPATGVSGLDLYARDCDGRQLWCKGNYSFADTISYTYSDLTYRNTHRHGDEFTLYLPLYNGVKWMEIGVPDSCEFSFLPPSTEKPIVVYGTSIAQGACASRPGMAWTNILQRRLDAPVINLGFSGNGQLDESFFKYLSEIDAAMFVIDCMPNMTGNRMKEIVPRLRAGLKMLRSKSKVPILLVEHDGYQGYRMSERIEQDFRQTNVELRKAYEEMRSEIGNLHYLTFEELGLDMDNQVDGVHASDLGMAQYAEAYYKKIAPLLYPTLPGLKREPSRQHRDLNTYNWDLRHEAVLAYNRANKPDIVMVGNSITHFWGGQPNENRRVADDVWQKLFKKHRAANLGCGWDRIENVAWRIQHGELDGYEAKHIFLMLGTNNLSLDTDEEIVSGIKAVVNQIKEKQPTAQIHVIKILPRRNYEARLMSLNTLLEKTLSGEDRVDVVDCSAPFLGKDGKIKEELFRDGLHPNHRGYELWAKLLKKVVDK